MATAAQLDARAIIKLPSLAWLDETRRERLADAATTFRVRRGQSVFYEGESSSRTYVLLSGVAKLSIQKGDERVLVGLVGSGEVFGASSLLPEATRPFRCDAFTDCSVAAIAPETFVETVLGVPLHRVSRMLDVTVGRWWAMLIRYANFVGLGLRERLATALLEVATRFGVRDSRGTLLTLKLTHADLAELVGASRQRITEQLIDFERERMIIRDGRRLIIVPERLWQATGVSDAAHRAKGKRAS